MPDGYAYRPTPSAFVEHVGKTYLKTVIREDGEIEKWAAMRVERHHVNSWNFAHGGFMLNLAEIGNGQASWEPEAPPCVAIELNTQFIGAPKLGDIVEVCGTITKRTRSLVFTQARGEVAGKIVFLSTSIQKVVDC